MIPFWMLYAPIKCGGVGRMPYVMRGANLDALIAVTYTGRLREVVNNAIRLNRPETDIRTEIARAVLSYGDLNNGLTFAEKHLNQTKRLNAKQAADRLAIKGIWIKFDYRDSAFEQIFSAVRDSPNLQKFDNLRREGGKALMIEKDYINEALPWLDGIRIEWLDPIAPKLSNCPIVGLDPWLATIVKTFGVCGKKGLSGANLNNIFGILRRDPEFPAYLRPETIAEVVSRPDILYNPEVLADVLVKMGAKPEDAYQLVTKIQEHVDEFLFMNNSKTFSMNDALGSWLDTSKSQMFRLVEVPPIDADPMTERMLYHLGLCLIYCIPYGSPIRKVRIRADMNKLVQIRRFLSKYFYDRSLDNWNIFPDRDM